ncbi:MAG: TonB-dependent receptor [Sphingobium sp.]
MVRRFAQRLALSGVSLAVLAASYAENAHAQFQLSDSLAEASNLGAGEIVVTARRRDEAAQDVPISLSVIGAADIRASGTSTFNQIQQLVATLQVTTTNARNSNVTIRGLGANATIAIDGLEAGVGFYVDGVYYGRPGQSQFDLIDLQQIEVLNGPQGTLFGKNTTAGAINITTRAPSFDPELVVEGNVGNYDQRQLRASGSAPIIQDRLAVRLTAAYTDRKGFLTNVFNGRDAQDYENLTLRGQVLAKPVDDVTVRIIGDYSRQKQYFMLAINDEYFTTLANGARIANNIFDRSARLGYTPLTAGAFNRKGDADSLIQAHMKSYGVSGHVDWDVGAATLTSITAYRWWDWDPRNDTDGTSLPILTKQHTSNRQRQFSQEFRVASNGENVIDYVAGLYYFWQVVRGYGSAAFGRDYAAWNYNPVTTPPATLAINRYAVENFEAANYSDPTTKSYAAFGQLDWHIAPSLTLTGGLRYTHEKKEGRFRQFWVGGNDLSILSPANRAIAMAARASQRELAFEARDSSNAVSGLVTLSFKPADEVLIYGTYSRGSKSGGLNLSPGGASRPVIAPEKVDNFEVGLKSQWLDRRLTFNAAAYLTNVRDYQANISEQTGPTTSLQYIANVPKVRSKGFETTLSLAPVEGLRLGASAAYTDARYVDYKNAAQAPERAYLGPIQDLSGTSMPLMPKFTYTLNVDASRPLGDSVSIYTRFDYLHRSSVNATATLSSYGVIPAYGVLNARVGFNFLEGRYDLSLWARNLGQKEFFVTKSVQPIGVVTGLPGEPRTLGATLRANF